MNTTNKKTKILAIGDVAVNREQPDSIFELVHEKIKEATGVH